MIIPQDNLHMNVSLWTRIHCYPGCLAIMTPDPGPFCDHSQRLPMVLTSHGLTTHVDPWHIFRELASTLMITELTEQAK